MIDRETQQKIKDAANIVEVVGDYVKLTRRGANYMGLCPFHNERTPSFSVSPRKNFCHCFSCKKGGSPVNFLMEKEGVSYNEALLILAKKYNIPVKERELSDEERERLSEREAMLVASEWAMNHFHENLYNTEEGREVGLAYLYGRGITDEAIKKFKLGYSIDRGDNFVLAVRKAGFDIEILKKIGIVGTSQRGHDYDKFHGRVIFPIRNASGKPVAFGGRALRGEAAKYINSPETPLYKKSNELYGIFEAKPEIIRQERVFLMEGYLDVIGSWQTGLKNAVASSGTALTESQIALIHRFSDNVTLIYDGDPAGIKASLRGIDMLLSHKLHVKVLLLPDGDDPDSFARKHTPEEFQKYIADHQTDFINYKLEVLLREAGNNPQEISEAVRSIVGSIASIPDEIERISYIKECSRKLGIEEKVIARQVASSILSHASSASHHPLKDLRSGTKINEIQDNERIGEGTLPDSSKERFKKQEQEILRCCIRYAFLPIKIDDETSMMVLDYVSEEMDADGITFCSPSFQKIFDILMQRKPLFEKGLETYKKEVEKELQKNWEKFREVLRISGGTMAKLKSDEDRFSKEQDFRREEMRKQFTIGFSVDYLINHEESEVREIANSLVVDKHTLSSIYNRQGTSTPLEEDKLEEVVPRALAELRSEILNDKTAELQQKIIEAIASNDTDYQQKLMSQLSKLLRIRSVIAENLGERIISPR